MLAYLHIKNKLVNLYGVWRLPINLTVVLEYLACTVGKTQDTCGYSWRFSWCLESPQDKLKRRLFDYLRWMSPRRPGHEFGLHRYLSAPKQLPSGSLASGLFTRTQGQRLLNKHFVSDLLAFVCRLYFYFAPYFGHREDANWFWELFWGSIHFDGVIFSFIFGPISDDVSHSWTLSDGERDQNSVIRIKRQYLANTKIKPCSFFWPCYRVVPICIFFL